MILKLIKAVNVLFFVTACILLIQWDRYGIVAYGVTVLSLSVIVEIITSNNRLRKYIPNLWVLASHHQKTILVETGLFVWLCFELRTRGLFDVGPIAIASVMAIQMAFDSWRWIKIKKSPIWGLYAYPAAIQAELGNGIKPTLFEFFENLRLKLGISADQNLTSPANGLN